MKLYEYIDSEIKERIKEKGPEHIPVIYLGAKQVAIYRHEVVERHKENIAKGKAVKDSEPPKKAFVMFKGCEIAIVNSEDYFMVV
jgi:hypothetical protein